MNIDETIELIKKYEVIPVASLKSMPEALKVSKHLIKSDLPIIEITFRTGNAPEYIEGVKLNFPDMLVGAGSVLNVKMAEDAINAGAEFIVMPGFNQEVVDFCKNKVLCIPGVLSPSEIMMAINSGMNILKLFPMEISGGIDYLKAVSAPFPNVKFIPTGGINKDNYQSYLLQKNVIAVGGSWPVDEGK